MANEQVYMTIITLMSAGSSVMTTIIVGVVLSFTNNTRKKFEVLFTRMGAEEMNRAVMDQRVTDELKLHNEKIENLKRRWYSLSELLTQLHHKISSHNDKQNKDDNNG